MESWRKFQATTAAVLSSSSSIHFLAYFSATPNVPELLLRMMLGFIFVYLSLWARHVPELVAEAGGPRMRETNLVVG